MRCASYCVAANFNMAELVNYLSNQFTINKYSDTLSVITADASEIFIFKYGAIVSWGLEPDKETQFLKILEPFVQQTESDAYTEFDLFEYTYSDAAKIQDDEIFLPDRNILTKLAFSHAIAQSVKLSTFEQTIQKTIVITREIPQRLATQGKISLSRNKIRKMMGRLFIERHSINLHQDLLDTPEFFWEYPDLEPIYNITAHYLEIRKRVTILNEKLSVLNELFDVLNNEMNHKHSSRLEWIIIILILIEVLLVFVTDLFHWF